MSFTAGPAATGEHGPGAAAGHRDCRTVLADTVLADTVLGHAVFGSGHRAFAEFFMRRLGKETGAFIVIQPALFCMMASHRWHQTPGP